MLQIRKWATKPGNIRGILAKHTLDILLSANNLTNCWDMTLIIEEYKSRIRLKENRKAII